MSKTPDSSPNGGNTTDGGSKPARNANTHAECLRYVTLNDHRHVNFGTKAGGGKILVERANVVPPPPRPVQAPASKKRR